MATIIRPHRSIHTKGRRRTQRRKPIAQLYDPIGLITPITAQAKILFQTLWLRKIGWDDTLPEPIIERYNNFMGNLQRCADFNIERALSTQFSGARFELHTLCDASMEIYGTVMYLRTIFDDKADARLIVAKARVVPIKNKWSIHRYELMGALMAARIAI